MALAGSGTEVGPGIEVGAGTVAAASIAAAGPVAGRADVGTAGWAVGDIAAVHVGRADGLAAHAAEPRRQEPCRLGMCGSTTVDIAGHRSADSNISDICSLFQLQLLLRKMIPGLKKYCAVVCAIDL